MDKKTKITPSLEDYLETIYFLDKDKNGVRVTDVAEEMDISKPSVNKAVNTLTEGGLVRHEHYGPLHLTEKGLAVAKKVARRHMLIKDFFITFLDVSETQAEIDACLIEHLISSETVKKLEDYMLEIRKEN